MSLVHTLILASGSPRRKDLLARAGFFFHVFSVQVSENLEKNLTIDEQILLIARKKALATLQVYKPLKKEPFLILAADTMVVVDGQPLGKPKNEQQAFDFLKLLSGRAHEVKTAVVLVEGPVEGENSFENLNLRQALETTQVIFRPLSEREIKEYIQTGEPMDKAGAYGIQGLAGHFVEKFVGSYDNVIGLPVDVVRKLIQEGGWNLRAP